MLNAVLKELNNYFKKYTLGVANYTFSKDVTFTSNDTLTATSFADTFIVGEYILIEDSRVNDGVYKISAIDGTTITIDTTIDFTITTEAEVTVSLTKLYIPSDVIELIDEIKTCNTNNEDGITSESQGSRSVSFDGGFSWKKAFSQRLSTYRKVRWY